MQNCKYCFSPLDGLRKKHQITHAEMAELLTRGIIVASDDNHKMPFPLYRYNPDQLLDILDEMERRNGMNSG